MNVIYMYSIIFLKIFWLIVNFCVKLIQKIWWELNGVSSTIRSSSRESGRKNAAQVLKVWAKFKIDEYVYPTSEWDFIATHDGFQSTEYVLQDHITLYSISDSHAIFVESSPGQKVWDTRIYPSFFMAAQFFSAKKIIKMSIESFHELAEKIGDPKGKLIFLTNCARCGSTLITQMFTATEKIISFGEPSCLLFLSQNYDRIKHSSQSKIEEFEHLTKSSIRLLCKQTESKQEIAYFIKLTSPTLPSIPLVFKEFPNSKFLYLYRNPIKVAQSIYRMSCSVTSVAIIFHFGLGSAYRFSKIMGAMGFPESYYKIRTTTNLGLGFGFLYALTLQYFDCKKKMTDFPALRYEDVIENPSAALAKIFNYCEVPLDLIPKALEALKWDSQKNTPFSNEALSKYPILPYEGDYKIEGEKLASSMGFPNPDVEFILEDTLTSSNNCGKKVISF